MSPISARALLLSLILSAGTAHADEPRTSSLGWVRLAGAETCAGPRDVEEAVESRLGRPVFTAPAPGCVAVEGRIERVRAPHRWRATITLADDRGAILGTRELPSDALHCRALDRQIAFVLTVMIGPAAALCPAPTPTPPAPPALRPPEALPAPSRAAEPPATPAARPRPWRAGLQIGFAGNLGMLPQAEPGATFRLHVAPPRGPVFEIGASVWGQGHADDMGTGTFDLAYGSLSVCPLALAVVGTSFFACAGTQIGSFHVQGVDSTATTNAWLPIFDLTAEVHLRRPLYGPIFAAAGLGLLVPIVREPFTAYGATNVLFRVSPVAGTAEVALGFAFPWKGAWNGPGRQESVALAAAQ